MMVNRLYLIRGGIKESYEYAEAQRIVQMYQCEECQGALRIEFAPGRKYYVWCCIHGKETELLRKKPVPAIVKLVRG